MSVTPPAFHNTSNLRLQVQAPFTGLNNLFPDPNAVLGTYALTPIVNDLTSDGTKFTAVTRAGASNLGNQNTSLPMPVTAGQYVKAWYTVTAATSGHTLRTSYYWYNADRVYLSSTAATAATVTSGVSYAPTAQAPAGAVLFAVVFTLYKGTTDVVDDSSSVSFNQVMASTASTTAALAGAFALVDPMVWSSSLLGKTHDITVDRHAGDVGTLSATIIDANLDPAVTGNLNRGDRVRLQALVSGTWEDIFVGQVDDADVTYRRVAIGGGVLTSISLSAVDNIATLANRPGPYGYGSFAYLAKVLNYTGVPFNSNGNRSWQGLTGTWTRSADATALEQICMMRDTSIGYAWTDRHNILSCYDRLNLITNPSAAVDVSGWASSATLTRDGTYGVGPAGAFKVVTASGSGAGTGYAYPNQGPGFVTAGPDTYLFEVWVFGTGSAYVQLYSNPGGAQFAISNTVALTGAWQKITLIGTAPAGTTTIYPVIRQASAGVQTLYFDEANLTPFGCYFTDVANAGALYEHYNDDIAVGWNRDEVINSVVVNFLRQTGDNLTVDADSVTFGPYNDQPSILKNGARQKTFTIQGIPEANIPAYAASILAANKTPVRKTSQLVMPVKNTRSLGHAATLDLYDLVGVKYSTVLDTAYRITSIRHSITTDKWLATYGFGTVGAVASPARAA